MGNAESANTEEYTDKTAVDGLITVSFGAYFNQLIPLPRGRRRRILRFGQHYKEPVQ